MRSQTDAGIDLTAPPLDPIELSLRKEKSEKEARQLLEREKLVHNNRVMDTYYSFLLFFRFTSSLSYVSKEKNFNI